MPIRIPWYILIVLSLLLFAMAADTLAQSGAISWTPIRQIPNFDRISRAPLLAAGPDGTLHAFNVEGDEDWGQMIMYRDWTLQRGWSNATAVLMSTTPEEAAGVFAAFVDDSNFIHLIYYSGLTEGATIYYTFAPATEAGKATAWATPEPIALNGGPLFNGALASDGQDSFFLVYQGQDTNILTGPGLYFVYSLDGGVSWSSPEPIFFTYSDNLWPWSIRLLFTDDGRLHAVWSVINGLGVGDEVYYSRLDDPDGPWAKPYLLARREGNDYSANWPAIINDEETLLVVYQDSFPAARFMRRSLDGGETWLGVERPVPHVGEYENPVLLKDSSGTIHLITGSRIGDPGIHGLWHAIWLGERWSELTPITSGPRTDEYDPSAPQAIIIQGNILLATWWNNVPREYLTGAWHSYALLDAPDTATMFSAQTLPIQPTNIDTAGTAPAPTLELSPDMPESLANSSNPTGENLASPLYLGVLASFLLIVVVLSVKRIRKTGMFQMGNE